MADNNYCNLVGTNNIKDEFPKITAGFGLVDADVIALKADIAQRAVNVKSTYGAKGDNVFHTIATVFPDVTLSQVQALNASATLNNSADWYALQKAIDSGDPIFIPEGNYLIDLPLNITGICYIKGVYGQTYIRNQGTGHAFTFNNDDNHCLMENIIEIGSSTTGSGVLIAGAFCNFNHCEFSGNGRYGVEFSSTVHVVNTKIKDTVIFANKFGGVFIASSGTSQKNVISFDDCYLNGNGDAAAGVAQTDGGHGFFISGGIAVNITNTVSEYNHGAGLYVSAPSGYFIYGLNVIGCHFEANRYANVYVDTENGTVQMITIKSNYYLNPADIAPFTVYTNSLIPTYGEKTIISTFDNLTTFDIDFEYESAKLRTDFLLNKQSLKPNGDFEVESIGVVTGDVNSNGYNAVKVTQSSPSYTERDKYAVAVDPSKNYRLVNKYRYNKNTTTNAVFTLQRLDRDKRLISDYMIGRTTPLANLAVAASAGDTVLQFDDLSGWTIDSGGNYTLQIYNFVDSGGYAWIDTYARNVEHNLTGTNISISGNNLTLPAGIAIDIAVGTPCALRLSTVDGGADFAYYLNASSGDENDEYIINASTLKEPTRFLQLKIEFAGTAAADDWVLMRSVNLKKLDGVVADSSTTANRPTRHVTGHMHFDTTLGKPIWWNGSAWVDATGTTV